MKATDYPMKETVGKEDRILVFTPGSDETNTLKVETLADAVFDANANRIVNPNLLDNWYFLNPVNQRGAETYDSKGYTIDRWKFEEDEWSLTFVNGAITLRRDGNYATGWFQIIEHAKELSGMTITFSVLSKETNGSFMLKVEDAS